MVKNLKFWQFCSFNKLEESTFISNKKSQMIRKVHEQHINNAADEDSL